MRRIRILQRAGASSFYDEDQGIYVQWPEMEQLIKRGDYTIDEFDVHPNGFDLIIAFGEGEEVGGDV